MKQSKLFILFLCVFYGIHFHVSGQISLRQMEASLSSGFLIGNPHQQAYFLRNMAYGTVPSKGSAWATQINISQDIDSIAHSPLAIRYAIQGNLNLGKETRVLLPEAYLQLASRKFSLYVGRKREIFGIADSSLSSGSYIWSGNALPLPKVQASTKGFVSLGKRQLFAFNTGMAHGWFGNDSVQRYFLHQKWFYGRLGKPEWRVQLFAGFNHQVQWGGKPMRPYIETQTGKLISDYGNDWATYLKVVSGISRNAQGNGTDINGLPLNEALNRSGNHLGTIDIATQIRFNYFRLLVYRQSIYEDGSLYYLSNISDGLTGISLRSLQSKSIIQQINLEWLRTDNQGGATGSGNTIPELRGGDNYFNNGIYDAGWTYKGQVIGTPLLTPLSQLNPALLQGNTTLMNPSAILNNRVKAFSLAISGSYQAWDYQSRLVISSNWGTYGRPLDNVRQVSFLQNLSYQRGNLHYIARLAFDSGTLYTSQFGAYVGIRTTIF